MALKTVVTTRSGGCRNYVQLGPIFGLGCHLVALFDLRCLTGSLKLLQYLFGCFAGVPWATRAIRRLFPPNGKQLTFAFVSFTAFAGITGAFYFMWVLYTPYATCNAYSQPIIE